MQFTAYDSFNHSIERRPSIWYKKYCIGALPWRYHNINLHSLLLTGDFSVTIRSISKDKSNATRVDRAKAMIQEAYVQGLPQRTSVLSSTLEWRLVSEAELVTSKSLEGTLMSEGTTEWIISKRSVPGGIYLVKFIASVTIGNPAASSTLQAFDYGFIESIPGPLRAIIDGGNSVRWGSENVTVDGSLSYDGDIGPGTHTGINFSWSCRDKESISYDCFGAFSNKTINATVIRLDTSKLSAGKTYVLRLILTKENRRAFATMSVEIASGEIPQITLR